MARRTPRLILECLLASVAIAGALPASAEAKVLWDEAAQYRITVPDAWDVTRWRKAAKHRRSVLYVSSEGRKVRVRVRARPSPTPPDLRGYLKDFEKRKIAKWSRRYARVQQGFGELPDGRIMGVSQYVAEIRRQRAFHRYRIYVMAIYSASRKMRYTLTVLVQHKHWKAKEREIDAIMGSFDLM